MGYAPATAGTLTFGIAANPAHGTLNTPQTVECQTYNMMMSAAVKTSAEIAKDPLSQAAVPEQTAESADAWASLNADFPAAAAQDGDVLVCLGKVVYTPIATDPLYVGSDSFTFTVSDGTNISAPANINLWVDANSAPTALDGSALVNIGSPNYVLITATDPDTSGYTTDKLTFYIDSNPASGTLGTPAEAYCDWLYDEYWNPIARTCTNAVLYTPNPGAIAGTDSFTFHVNDTHQDSNAATVSLILRAPATLHVNTADDMVDETGCDATHCSLREAVDAAQPGDIIDFTLSLPNTIFLSGQQILINKDINYPRTWGAATGCQRERVKPCL